MCERTATFCQFSEAFCTWFHFNVQAHAWMAWIQCEWRWGTNFIGCFTTSFCASLRVTFDWKVKILHSVWLIQNEFHRTIWLWASIIWNDQIKVSRFACNSHLPHCNDRKQIWSPFIIFVAVAKVATTNKYDIPINIGQMKDLSCMQIIITKAVNACTKNL